MHDAAEHSRALGIDVSLSSNEHLYNYIKATDGSVVQRGALLPAANTRIRLKPQHNKHALRSLVSSLQVGAGIQENPDDGFMPVATGSMERGLLEAAVV